MRISDWSSDVCSSDLAIAVIALRDDRELPQTKYRLRTDDRIKCAKAGEIHRDRAVRNAALDQLAAHRARLVVGLVGIGSVDDTLFDLAVLVKLRGRCEALPKRDRKSTSMTSRN